MLVPYEQRVGRPEKGNRQRSSRRYIGAKGSTWELGRMTASFEDGVCVCRMAVVPIREAPVNFSKQSFLGENLRISYKDTVGARGI